MSFPIKCYLYAVSIYSKVLILPFHVDHLKNGIKPGKQCSCGQVARTIQKVCKTEENAKCGT